MAPAISNNCIWFTKLERSITKGGVGQLSIVFSIEDVANWLFFTPWHYSDATWASWGLKSWLTQMLVQQLVQVNNKEQGKSEGFDSCDWPYNLTQIGFKSSIFSPCDLEHWWMTSKNNRATLLYYIKLCVSFQSHLWTQTEVTIRKRSILVTIDDFVSPVTLNFDGWLWEMIGHLFYNTSSFCASFQSHRWFQTWVTAWIRSIRATIDDFFCPEILRMTLKNNRAPLLSYVKLCTSFRS